MEELIHFLTNLFSTEDWPPRWVCGKWSEFHGWLYIGSDIIIWLAYFIIPVIIIWFIQKRPDIPFVPVFWLFGAFIILCGSTHLIDAVIFWWPAYRISALLKLLTAVVSMATVFALIRDLPKVLDLKSDVSKQLEIKDALIAELQEEIIGLKNKN
ncbi:hypothetical protein SAMN05421640_1563 [Ekhidna lutea]|uniref:Ethylene receptor 1-like N-terminal domain-containing protein n=1 Tax=Ekhidna lutea TaxID=447679 RepID=A0A239HXR5_EKHLU|nr:hypothetical protein [Ekhidna lutea]SNS86079.1 hypothetical protein SAMN05421640_1563 [Ekhidna lutea]